MLLEIETDKAQMDVEAQDDGKMAKITVWSPRETSVPTNTIDLAVGRRWSESSQSRHTDSRTGRDRR